MKKGQGLGLNTIVIAALAVLVLVVLSYIFLGGIEPGTKTTQCSTIPNAICQEDSCGDGMAPHNTATCAEEGERCCVPVGQQGSS